MIRKGINLAGTRGYSFCTYDRLEHPCGNGVTPSLLKITCWNINGMRSITDKGNLKQLAHTDDSDIICLNETRIEPINYRKLRV